MPTRRGRRVRADDLVELVEDRWATVLAMQSQRRAELAVGLRFDVFNRDGFRCVYCGRSASDGVTLEADHRIARANGGTDDLDNLVTSCRDCNRGKSAKALTA
jgi:5-methylcytosine-specific restriction endonuclease McrA